MRILLMTLLIILTFPLLASAHGKKLDFDVPAGTLPGEPAYFFEKIGEWLEVNLFTLSTKAKQAKKLEFATERLAEFMALLEKNPQERLLRQTLLRYQTFLREAQDMAEKIIFLDGAEVGIGRGLEEATRTHEIILGNLLLEHQSIGVLQEFLATARIENRDMFEYLVKHYQLTDEDISFHQTIVQKHVEILENYLDDIQDKKKIKQVSDLIKEIQKLKEAGLNLEAYGLVDMVKNLLY